MKRSYRQQRGDEVPATASLTDILDRYVRDTFEAEPVLASKLGVHDHDDVLPDVSADAFAARERRHKDLLRVLEAVDPAQLDPHSRLDLRVGLIEAKTGLKKDELVVWKRAPYVYSGMVGDGLSSVMSRDGVPLEQRAAAVRSRLAQTPSFLRSAAANLGTETPRRWAQIGLAGARGLQRFLTNSIPQFAAPLPGALRSEIDSLSQNAAASAAEFAEVVERLVDTADGRWACGPEHFDFLLAEHHLIELDHEDLFELGRQMVADDTAKLVAFAARQDSTRSWQEQIARIKDHHPEPAEFINTYHNELLRARQHVLNSELATLPDGEICRMDWVPEYMRESLPIAVMSTTPPFEVGLESRWLITPSNPDAPMERRVQQMRDNCYVFAESIAGHEIYPGHHLQKVHHKISTRNSMIRRYFSSPQFVEGWGLYTEDLFEETGFFANPPVLLFKLRNSLWRSLRVVIDVGLHTKGMSFEEAVDLLMNEAAMDRHMAEGEVTRYIGHDNPTYPSSYQLGRQRFHQLRERYFEQNPRATLKSYHDTVMSFGSLPLKLVADMMLDGAQPGGNP